LGVVHEDRDEGVVSGRTGLMEVRCRGALGVIKLVGASYVDGRLLVGDE
jgi:hypothetical protein